MTNLLPYAFARDYGVLARSNGDPSQAVEVLVSNATKPAAIAEVSRRYASILPASILLVKTSKKVTDACA